MTTKNTGGPAFPETRYSGNSNRQATDETPGMTLRAWLSGQALPLVGTLLTVGGIKPNDGTDTIRPDHIAEAAVAIADALIAELAK